MAKGNQITVENSQLTVPNDPIIPFIEGDGTGPDIWAAASRVLEAAVEKAYNGEKEIVWEEVLAGQKARSEEHTSESSHVAISYAVFCLKKKKKKNVREPQTKTLMN